MASSTLRYTDNAGRPHDTRYIATTRKGLVVASFDSEALGWKFIADRRKRNVKLELWEEATVRTRCRKALKVAA